MVRNDLWALAFAERPARTKDAQRCTNDLESWLGRQLTQEETREVALHFGTYLCLVCFTSRIGRDLRIPDDLLAHKHAPTLPINRALIHGYMLGKQSGDVK
jgi:hypothetical protein